MTLFRFLPEPLTPPGVGASCLRKKYVRHHCDACATVCPVNAIRFSGTDVAIDEADCIHCGHCLFVCPTGSLQHIKPVSRRYYADTLVAPFSLLAPTTEELMMWHREYGIRQVALDMDRHPAWALAIAGLNVRLRAFSEPAWRIVPPGISQVHHARRHLMHIDATAVKSGKATPACRVRRRLYDRFSEYEMSLTLPQCTACGACARACPEKALQMTENALEWSSQHCTGCGSCTAVCVHHAIMIQPRIQQNQITKYPVIRKVCSCCRQLFGTMHAEQERCHICQRREHTLREA